MTLTSNRILTRLAALAGAAAALTLGACSGINTSSLNPFSSGPFSNASQNDLIFVRAASTWDLNKDNDVTCDEWKQYTGELLAEADGNKDGILSDVEYGDMSRRDRLFEVVTPSYFDKNNDKKVTLAELQSAPNPGFRLLDKNKDCKIARTEMVVVRDQIKKKDEGEAPTSIPQ